jgi:hypothetical protein
MINLKIKIGNSVLEFQANTMKEIHKFSAIYGMLPSKCDACKSPEIFLNHKAPKGNDYFGLRCKTCGAELTLHQKKEGGFFIKQGEKMEVYKPENNQAAGLTKEFLESKKDDYNPNEDEDLSSIPF